jgi:dienelactone hydrolase
MIKCAAVGLSYLQFVVCGAAWCESTSPWNLEELRQPPSAEAASDFAAEGVQAVFFDGAPWKGKPTKVFAYYGLPHGASPKARVPGVVCVHGGGGTAFAEWVRIWNSHGFAAIALDTNGAVPEAPADNEPDKHRHQWAGPPRYGFDQAQELPQDQWPYHAVASIVLANSLLRAMPDVDPDRIGITGISWGGYLTSLVAGVDDRFSFAIPVYGCGFVHEGTSWNGLVDEYGRQRWVSLWDPSSHLGRARMPMLWVNGTNDEHYHLPLFQKSYRLPRGSRWLAIRVRMDHGHGSGWSAPEIYAFAKAAVGQGEPLVTIGEQGREADEAWVAYKSPGNVRVKEAQLHYTVDKGPWVNRFWQTTTARMEQDDGRVIGRLPEGTVAYYFNLVDNRGLLVSSEHTEIH